MDLRRTTVSSVLNVYNLTGRVNAEVRGGVRVKKITDEIRDSIRQWIDENCGLTLKELACKVEDKYGIAVSITTSNRTIGSFNYSFKRTSLIPERRNCPGTIETRKNYGINFNNLHT
ncbi:hypothetical protein ENBRE01_3451, partial [Enteropsectra breve]